MAVEFGERSLRMLNLKPSRSKASSWLLLALWHLPVSVPITHSAQITLLSYHCSFSTEAFEFGCSCLTEPSSS